MANGSARHLGEVRRSNPVLIAGVLAGPLFIVGWTLQDLTRHGFDPMREQVSQLALGDNGWQQAVNFILSGALLVTFGIGLRRASRWGRLIPALMIAAGLAFVVAALFPTNPTNSSSSSTSGIHDLAATVWFLSMLTAGIATGLRFHRQQQDLLGIYSVASVVAMIVFLTISSIGMARFPGFVEVGGLFERLSIGSALVWVAVLAIESVRGPSVIEDTPEMIAKSGAGKILKREVPSGLLADQERDV